MNKILFLFMIQRIVIINGYPVHGGWTLWADPRSETRCTITCGRGLGTLTMSLTRSCTSPRPRNGGRDCHGQKKKLRTTKCVSTISCPIHGSWSDWTTETAWQCQVTCGSGIRKLDLERFCNKPAPKHGGHQCAGDSKKKGVQACATEIPCDAGGVTPNPPVNGGWADWVTDGSPTCSVTCGKGTLTEFKRRKCNKPTPRYGGRHCEGPLVQSKLTACNAPTVCKIDGGWSEWVKGKEGSCSVTCGLGIVLIPKTRKCNDPKPLNGGKKCTGNGTDATVLACDTGLHCIADQQKNTPSKQVSKSSTGLIIGIAVPVVIIIALAVGGIYFFRKKKAMAHGPEGGAQIIIDSSGTRSTLSSITRSIFSTAGTKSTMSSGTKSTFSTAGAKSTLSSSPTKQSISSPKSAMSHAGAKSTTGAASPKSTMSASPTKQTMASPKSTHGVASPKSTISSSPTKQTMASPKSAISHAGAKSTTGAASPKSTMKAAGGVSPKSTLKAASPK